MKIKKLRKKCSGLIKNRIKRYLFLNRFGFSLIELLIAISIVGIISISLAVFLDKGMDAWISGEKKADIVYKSKVGLDRMIRELKHTIRNSITVAGSSSIEFKADLDKDGDNETIKYDISGSEVRRTQDSGTAYAIIKNVNSLTINYYNSSRTQFTPSNESQRDNIRYVEVILNMEENVSLDSRAYLKNFKTY